MENGLFGVFEPLWEAYGQRTMIILGSLESACGLPISINLIFFC